MADFSISKIAGSAANKVSNFTDDTKNYFTQLANKKFRYDDLIGAHLGGTSAAASGATTATPMNTVNNN